MIERRRRHLLLLANTRRFMGNFARVEEEPLPGELRICNARERGSTGANLIWTEAADMPMPVSILSRVRVIYEAFIIPDAARCGSICADSAAFEDRNFDALKDCYAPID